MRRNPELTVEKREKIIAAPHAASKIEIKIMQTALSPPKIPVSLAAIIATSERPTIPQT